jgi:hypothetical protein
MVGIYALVSSKAKILMRRATTRETILGIVNGVTLLDVTIYLGELAVSQPRYSEP